MKEEEKSVLGREKTHTKQVKAEKILYKDQGKNCIHLLGLLIRKDILVCMKCRALQNADADIPKTFPDREADQEAMMSTISKFKKNRKSGNLTSSLTYTSEEEMVIKALPKRKAKFSQIAK